MDFPDAVKVIAFTISSTIALIDNSFVLDKLITLVYFTLKGGKQMRKFLILGIATLVLLAFVTSVFAATWVNGYLRKDGTYVSGYWRSDPNDTVRDNFSYKGNLNPYTGKKGTKPYRDNPTSEYYDPSYNLYSPSYPSYKSYAPSYKRYTPRTFKPYTNRFTPSYELYTPSYPKFKSYTPDYSFDCFGSLDSLGSLDSFGLLDPLDSCDLFGDLE